MSGSCKTITRINQVLSWDKLSIHHKFDWDTITRAVYGEKRNVAAIFSQLLQQMLRATFRETPAFGGVLSKFKSPGLFSKTCHENHQTWLFYAIVQLCKEAKFHVQAPRKLSCKESDRYPGISIMTTLKYHCFPQNMDHLLGILGHLNLRHIPNHPTAPSKPLHVPKRKKNTITCYICLQMTVQLWVNGGTFS